VRSDQDQPADMPIRRPTGFAVLLLLPALQSLAQLNLGGLNSSAGLDFTGFTGAGFAPNPTAGQLDSDTIIVWGQQQNQTPAFGSTLTDSSFASGAVNGSATPNNLGQGIYALTTMPAPNGGTALGWRTGGGWVPDTYLIFHILNTSGSTIPSIRINYDLWYLDAGTQSHPATLYHGSGANPTTHTIVAGSTYTTPTGQSAGNPSPFLQAGTNPRSFIINNVNIAANSSYYFSLRVTPGTGNGTDDPFGFDNITVTHIPETTSLAALGAGMVGLIGWRRRDRRRAGAGRQFQPAGITSARR
jgi:hypothetical protein